MNVGADARAAIAAYFESANKRFGPAQLERVQFACDRALSGTPARAPGRQAPEVFYFPGLPEHTYFDALQYGELAWVTQVLRDHYASLREEYVQHVRTDDLQAYEEQVSVARPLREGRDDGVLLPKEKWGTFSLRVGGQRIPSAAQRCPVAASLIDTLGTTLAADGALFFTVLSAGTRIPPHHDATNMRITCHLGLIVPQDCGIRVDGAQSGWREAECLFFDSTYEHEVWNDSNVDRVCLMMDLWNPALTQVERSVLTSLQQILSVHTQGKSQ